MAVAEATHAAAQASMLPNLTGLDALSFVISLAGAGLLHLVRKRNGRDDGTEQWLGDALSCGTLFVLLMIALRIALSILRMSALDQQIGLSEMVASNGYLVAIALANCGRAIAKQLCDSIKRKKPSGTSPQRAV